MWRCTARAHSMHSTARMPAAINRTGCRPRGGGRAGSAELVPDVAHICRVEVATRFCLQMIQATDEYGWLRCRGAVVSAVLPVIRTAWSAGAQHTQHASGASRTCDVGTRGCSPRSVA